MLNTGACGLLLQTKWRGPINMSVNLGRMTGVYTSGRGEYPGGMPGAGNVRAGMSSGRREKYPREMSVVGKETARTPPDWLSVCWSGPRALQQRQDRSKCRSVADRRGLNEPYIL